MNSLTLYQLADEYRQLLELAASDEADEESFGAALDAMQGEITTHAVALAQVARNLESFDEQIDAAIETMARRANRAKHRATAIRAYLKEQMEKAGISKLDSPFFSLAIRKNPPKLLIAEDALIPRDYLRIIPERLEYNKPEITKALKAGADVDGCRLETTTRLEIK
jgi:hypothetical protein